MAKFYIEKGFWLNLELTPCRYSVFETFKKKHDFEKSVVRPILNVETLQVCTRVETLKICKVSQEKVRMSVSTTVPEVPFCLRWARKGDAELERILYID